MPMLNLDKKNEWAMSGPIWEHWPRLVLPQIAALTTSGQVTPKSSPSVVQTIHPFMVGLWQVSHITSNQAWYNFWVVSCQCWTVVDFNRDFQALCFTCHFPGRSSHAPATASRLNHSHMASDKTLPPHLPCGRNLQGRSERLNVHLIFICFIMFSL